MWQVVMSQAVEQGKFGLERTQAVRLKALFDSNAHLWLLSDMCFIDSAESSVSYHTEDNIATHRVMWIVDFESKRQ
jgi:hypothetical protein